MTGEPAVNETGSRAQAGSDAGSDVGADAALVLAAVARMQAADQEARETLARLRTGLGAMADAIDRAKAQNAATAAAGDQDLAKVVDIAALLDEFEHLVDGLIEVATGQADEAEPAPTALELPQPAEPGSAPDTKTVAAAPADVDRVPTVSDVVSRLDPEQPVDPAGTEAGESALTQASVPSVEMLKSLVEALNASIPDGTPEAEALAESSGYKATAKVMAQDVIEAIAWELTRADPRAAQEAAAAATVAAETNGALQVLAPQVVAAEVPEPATELAEIAPVQAAEPARAQPTEPLVFDVVVEFDPIEPQAVAQVESAEAAAPETVAPDTQAAEPIAAAAPDASIGTVEPGLDIADAAQEIVQAETEPPIAGAAAPEVIETIPVEAMPESAADIAAAEAPDTHAEAAPLETTSAEAAPVATTAPAEPAATEAPPAATGSVVGGVVVYEVELMARLEQMEALPILPPELGTAVIFGRRDAQPRNAADTAELKSPADLLPAVDLDVAPEAAPVATAEAVAEAAPECAVETESQAMAQPAEDAAGEVAVAETLATADPIAAEEVAAEIVAEPAPEVVAQAVPEAGAATEPVGEIAAPEAVAEPAPEAPAEAAPQAADGEAGGTKLADLDAEADSDEFLFEPADGANSTASTNDAEAAPGELAAATPPAVEKAPPGAPAKPAAPADPLIPIRAMSPEERIALFS